MIVFLEALFAVLLIADTWLTYRIIESGKGVEIGPVAKYYIHSKFSAITLTVICWLVLVGWLRLTGLWFFLIPVDLYMGRLVYRNWRVLHG